MQEVKTIQETVLKDKRNFSDNAALIIFGALFLWISYALILLLGNAQELIEILLPALILPAVLAVATVFLTIRSMDVEHLEKRRFGGYWKRSLTDNRFGKWLARRRWIQFLLEFPNVLFFFLVIAAGIYGYGGYKQADDAGFVNAATFLTWNLWWVGIIFAFVLLGRIWCTVCPLGCIGEWAHRTHFPAKSQITKKGWVFRIIAAMILGTVGAILLGVTIGLFGGYDAETLMGSKKLSSNLIMALPEYFGFVVSSPTHFIDVLFTRNLQKTKPSEVGFGLLWLGGIALGFVIGAVSGYLLLEFTRSAVMGTPLEQERDPKRKYPKRLRTLWITIGLFAAIMIFDFAIGMFVNPFYTALFVVLLISMSIIMGLVYERRAFCQYVCPLAGIIGTYSQTGMVEIRNKDPDVCRKCKTKDCLRGRKEANGVDAFGNSREFDYPAGYACPMGQYPMTLDQNYDCIMCFECLKSCRNDNISLNIRPPLVDTYNPKRRRFDQAALAAVLVGLTLAVILPDIPEFARVYESLLDLGFAEHFVIVAWFLFFAFVVPIGSFFFILNISKKLSGLEKESTTDLFKIFAFSIIPIGLTFHLAFWVIRIFLYLPSTLSVLADPFGGYFMDHTLFDSSGDLILNDAITFPIALLYVINPLFLLGFHDESLGPLVSTDFALAFRIMIILLGMSGSIYSAFRAIALNLPNHAEKRLRIMIPIIIWIVLITAVGLWALR